MRNWKGNIKIGNGVAEVIVAIIDPTVSRIGEWYGSGTFISGSRRDLLIAFTEGKPIDTILGTILIDKINEDGDSYFTFAGIGNPLV